MSTRGAVGVGILGGAILTLVIFGGGAAQRDQDDKEIREGCLTTGAVDERCPNWFPDVEHCTAEDCPDIKGAAGFWQDPSDATGRTWYFTIRPDMREAPQKPGQS